MGERHATTRRRFLKGIAAAALGAPAASLLAGTRGASASENERIGIGLIGCGSLGTSYHLPAYLPMRDVRLVSLCDVDARRRERAARQVAEHYGGSARPTTHNDFRELLDRKDVDAVIVVTPDHWHALATIHACQAGKDVHCEKPLSLTIEEGRAMVAAARRHGRVVQTGSESRSHADRRRACELVRSGHLGELRRVRTGLGANPFSPWSVSPPCPDGLDWDFWLGPAPERPYHRQRCHYTFRWFRDTSGGKLTDWGAHLIDIAQWGMGTDDTGPVRVRATARYAPGNFYEFPPEFEVTYTYASGVELIATGDEPDVTFEGTEGVLHSGMRELRSDPPEILEAERSADDVHLYRSGNHDRNWIDCIRSRRRPVADIEIGHRSSTVCHLGNIAMWLGREIRWDPEAEMIVGDEEASRLLSRPMRAPWHLT